MIELTPITRLENFLDGIVKDHTLLDPVARIEFMLSDIKAGNVTTIQPITRIEYYLAKISGADVEIPEPVTRIEMYLAKIAGMDIAVPEPITRVECWLEEWANGEPPVPPVPPVDYETVKGIAPLVVVNALAEPLHALIQYGKCEVSGSEITCNNGTLSVSNGEIVTTGTPEEIQLGVKANLITGWVEDYYIAANGTPTAEAGSHYTDLIPVESNGFYVLSFTAGADNNKRMHEYDSNGNWIRQCFYIKPAINDEVVVAFPVGSTTKYIRWSTKTVDTNVAIAKYNDLSVEKFSYYIDEYGVENFTSDNKAWYSNAYTVDSSETYYIQSIRSDSSAKIRVHGYTGTGLDSWVSQIYSVEISSSKKTDYHQLEIPQNVQYIRISGNLNILSTLLPVNTDSQASLVTATAANLYAVGESKDEQDIITGKVTRRNNVIVYDGTQEVGDNYIGTKSNGNIVIYPKETTQTGEVVTFTHDVEEPLNELKVEFMATQEGTGDPSPTNVRPIVGVKEINAYLESAYDASVTAKITVTLPPSGKNLIDKNKLLADKGVDDNGEVVDYRGQTLSDFIAVESGKGYIYSKNGNREAMYYARYNSNKEFIKKSRVDGVLTVESGVSYLRLQNSSVVFADNIQFEQNNSITSYEPFIPQMGGYVKLMSGKGVSELQYRVFDGSSDENWDVDQWGSFYIGCPDAIVQSDSQITVPFCDILKPIANKDRSLYDVPRIYGKSNYNQISIRGVAGVTTVEELKAWLAENPVTCAYILATPKTFEIPQSHLQLRSGTNAVWSDAEQVTAYIPSVPVIENVTAQPITPPVEGDNTLSVTANVNGIEFEVQYVKGDDEP